jgi:TRAP transporter 4TM/12TM fusion protein
MMRVPHPANGSKGKTMADMPNRPKAPHLDEILADDSEEKDFVGARELDQWVRYAAILLTFIGVGGSAFHISGLNIAGHVMWPRAYYSLLMACFLPLVFLMLPHRKGVLQIPWFDYCAAVVSTGVALYLFVKTLDIEYQGWQYAAPALGVVAAFILCGAVLETARRSSGNVLFMVSLLFFTFPLYTEHLVGILKGVGFNLNTAVSYYVYGPEGVFGLVMKVMGDILMGYMVFAAVLQYTGGGKFFLDFSFALVGRSRGGPAKVAVIASALFGSINGAPVANVATTGAITIPAMKRLGYRPDYAGAVEACASTGGVLMPPVMGATAFIMAEILGVTYTTICVAAAVPSILYFLSILIQVDMQAIKIGLKGLPKDEVPSLKDTLKDGWPYLSCILVLMYELLILRDAILAPYHASVLLLLIVNIRKKSRLNRHQWLQMAEGAGYTISTLLATLLGVGFIIGSFVMTGVAYSFSNEIMALAGNNPALLLLLGALVSFVLGMGVTVTVCYIFLALTMAPPLIATGFDPLAVHLFVLYWGNLSHITPPVALAAFTAAGISGASPMKTGVTSTRLGIILYILPFVFVIDPALILHGPWYSTLIQVLAFTVGAVFFAGASEGYIYGLGRREKLFSPYRVMFFWAGLLLMFPNVSTNTLGLVSAIALIMSIIIKRQSSPVAEKR